MEYGAARGSMVDLIGKLPDGGTVLPALTERQYAALEYIYRYALEHRDYPTGQDIAEAFSVSRQAAHGWVTALIKKGYLYRDLATPLRSLRLTDAALERLRRDSQKELPGLS